MTALTAIDDHRRRRAPRRRTAATTVWDHLDIEPVVQRVGRTWYAADVFELIAEPSESVSLIWLDSVNRADRSRLIVQ